MPVPRFAAEVAPLPRTRAPVELTTAHFGAAAWASAGTASTPPSAAATRPARPRPVVFIPIVLRSAPPASSAGTGTPRQLTSDTPLDVSVGRCRDVKPRAGQPHAAAGARSHQRRPLHDRPQRAVSVHSPVVLQFRY